MKVLILSRREKYKQLYVNILSEFYQYSALKRFKFETNLRTIKCNYHIQVIAILDSLDSFVRSQQIHCIWKRQLYEFYGNTYMAHLNKLSKLLLDENGIEW